MNTLVAFVVLSMCIAQGFCLKCHECPASASMEECLAKQKVVECEAGYYCMTVEETPLAPKGQKAATYFRHTCAQAVPCHEFCVGKEHPCETMNCCNTDLCN
ncbi:uncharacterized protein LOC116614945 [Nematostella vectensis]|uniref:uncharacterized protein LOC116614945 n=1 Tax=Nematostella vectensis TaxID=45351 RepID=UPI002077136D|nr:uncharacterized protein LOC116614945 [Nematostella vectensis]